MLDRNGAQYTNTPATDLFLDRAKPSYIGGILEMANARLYGFWGSLTEGLRTGKLQNEAKQGGDLFATLYSDPDRLRGFLKAMTGISMGAARVIAERFPWDGHKTFLDLGCAEGAVPVAVASKHAHLTGGGFDLPPVKPHFDAFVAAHKLSDRVRFYPGDFFKDPLPSVDVLVMGHILHDWDLEQKRALIAKAYATLPKGGALVVYDAIIDDERRKNAFGLLMSLNMLIETPGGFDYTGADCMSWMKSAGFGDARVEPLLGPDSMVIGIK
jgi:SAM-dependent methyltransferase